MAVFALKTLMAPMVRRCRARHPYTLANTGGLENTSGFKAFKTTAAAVGQGVRVKIDSAGLILVAGATDPAIGVTTEPIAASSWGNVKLFSAPGTFVVQAKSAVTQGSPLYPAVEGKVDDTGVTLLGLVALEAAAADGDLIEVARSLTGA